MTITSTSDEVVKFKSWRACSKDRTAAIKHISARIGVFAAKKLNFAVANGEKYRMSGPVMIIWLVSRPRV